MIKLVITDLDNTLYDWVGWFIPAFYDMAEYVAKVVNKPLNEVLREYREQNQRHINIEPAYSTLALPCVTQKFPQKTWAELKEIFEPAFKLFRGTRIEKLSIYSHVLATLQELKARGIAIVGCTDSTLDSCSKRLSQLKADKYFSRLYVWKNTFYCPLTKPPTMPCEVEEINLRYRKPSPKLLEKICSDMGISPDQTLMVGDNLKLDMGMSNLSNIKCAWAKYGTLGIEKHMSKIDLISARSARMHARDKRILGNTTPTPDYILNSFGDILDIIDQIA